MTEKRQIVRHPTSEHGLVGLDAIARTIAQPSLGEEEVNPREIWAGIRRNRWLILACIVAAVAAAAFLTSRTTPVYQATATLKVEVKQSNLPGIYVSSSEGGVLGTEARVLESRTLAESAATSLALQLRLLEP